jgi:hypothetical protein
LWFFVKLLKQPFGEVNMCCFPTLSFVKWKDGVRNTRLCNLWGLKDLRRKKKANGLKKKRLDRSDPLETSSLSLMKKVMSYVVTGHNFGGL